jgi:hypothetical protein
MRNAHQSFTCEHREKVAENGLILRHPCCIGRVSLLDRLVINHDGDILVRLLIIAGEAFIELRGTDGWQNLGAPERVVVTPGFNVKLNTHSMCVQELSLYTYRTENEYIIINVTI